MLSDWYIPKTNLSLPGPLITASVARYWSPNACLPMQMGFVQPEFANSLVYKTRLHKWVAMAMIVVFLRYLEQALGCFCRWLVLWTQCLHTVSTGIKLSVPRSGEGYSYRPQQHLTIQNVPDCAIRALPHGLQAKLLHPCFVCHGFWCDVISVNLECLKTLSEEQ